MVGEKEGGELDGNAILDLIPGYDRPRNADEQDNEVQRYLGERSGVELEG